MSRSTLYQLSTNSQSGVSLVLTEFECGVNQGLIEGIDGHTTQLMDAFSTHDPDRERQIAKVMY